MIPADTLASIFQPKTNDPTWYRDDGSLKGMGFLGLMTHRGNPGMMSSEISVGVSPSELGPNSPKPGAEGYVDIPSMVPTLNRNQLAYLLSTPMANLGRNNPALMGSIHDTALQFARQRVAQGKPVFAGMDESPGAGAPQFLIRPQIQP